MEFSDIRAIISYAYNLHKGNYLETTSFRPSQLEFIRVYIHTHIFLRKEKKSKTKGSLVKVSRFRKRLDPLRSFRVSTYIKGRIYVFDIVSPMIARRNIFLIHACLPCKFSPNKFSPKVGHRAELCTRAHTSYLSFPFSTRSKLDANI